MLNQEPWEQLSTIESPTLLFEPSRELCEAEILKTESRMDLVIRFLEKDDWNE